MRGAWKGRPLREICEQVGAVQGGEIVLDRRIDPNQIIDFTAGGKSAREEIGNLAKQLGAGSSVFGSVGYIGPREMAELLQTLIVLRKEELIPRRRSPVGKWSLEPLDLGWSDLEEPREILRSWLSPQEITIANLELVPRDRWAGSELRGLTPIEGISLVLIQWDLTFEINASKKSLVLTKIPAEVSMSRNFSIPILREPGKRPTSDEVKKERVEWVNRLEREFPEAKIELSGPRIRATGLWEELEGIEARLSGREKVGGEDEVVPLQERRYTLRLLKNVSVRQVMVELEKGGVVFDYDPAEFEVEGIDLEKQPELEVQDISATEFYQKLFEPLGVSVELEGVRVLLRVKGK